MAPKADEGCRDSLWSLADALTGEGLFGVICLSC